VGLLFGGAKAWPDSFCFYLSLEGCTALQAWHGHSLIRRHALFGKMRVCVCLCLCRSASVSVAVSVSASVSVFPSLSLSLSLSLARSLALSLSLCVWFANQKHTSNFEYWLPLFTYV